MATNSDHDEFIAIYAEEYGVQLSREEARPIAANLVNLYRLISRPPPNAGTLNSQNDPAMS